MLINSNQPVAGKNRYAPTPSVKTEVEDHYSSNSNTEDSYQHYSGDRIVRRVVLGTIAGFTTGVTGDPGVGIMTGMALGGVTNAARTSIANSRPAREGEQRRDPNIGAFDVGGALVGGAVIGTLSSGIISSVTMLLGGGPITGALTGAVLGAAGL